MKIVTVKAFPLFSGYLALLPHHRSVSVVFLSVYLCMYCVCLYDTAHIDRPILALTV